MGVAYADIGIENQFSKRRMGIRALVVSGAVFMTIPVALAK